MLYFYKIWNFTLGERFFDFKQGKSKIRLKISRDNKFMHIIILNLNAINT